MNSETTEDPVPETSTMMPRLQPAAMSATPNDEPRVTVFELSHLSVHYGTLLAVEDVDLDISAQEITAFIGPSGCGKTTVLRSLNRMHDITPGAEVLGKVTYHGQDLYGSKVDPAEVRRRIGMVFQKPNPFPKSVYDNVAYGPRINGTKRSEVEERVEKALTQAALWDEVHGKLRKSALALSGGQQQRLCIARCLAVEPDVILMDEPCSALDPIATARIEDLMHELKNMYTIVIVTHNMQQAARVSEDTAFFNLAGAGKPGNLVEMNPTRKIFSNPEERATEAYISGRFG